MWATHPRYRPLNRLRTGLLLGGTVLLLGGTVAWAQDSARAAAPADSVKKLPPDQLQSLVAPVALYPDDLLAQTLVASTYPLEVIQLHQWLEKHPGLKDKALADSVAKQPWDPAIQSMAAVPEVVKRLADDIQWATDLGNAFLAQQAEVMNAVQVMRKKAKEKGALESNEQQKVETKVVEQKQVIVVESANPEVSYVPSYSPTVVYGPPVYPYPPVYYPPYYAGAAFVSFSVGMMWGAAMWGGACCHAGWGGGNVYINHNNNFNRNVDRNRNVNRDVNRSGNWQHNPQHRGGTPYGDQRTADRYGGSTRGDRAAGTGRAERGAGVSDRSAGAGQNRGAGASAGNRAAGGTGSDRIGNRDIPSDGGSRAGTANRGSSSGFSGGSRGYDGASARASSARGASSMGARGGGGFRGGGGGGRGGGGRR